MTREEALRLMMVLAGTMLRVMRRLRPDAAGDAAGLLDDLAAMRDAYQAAGQAVAMVAYGGAVQQQLKDDATAEMMPTEEALAAVRRVAEMSPTWEVAIT